MAFKMKGAPQHDLSSKHGTNANFKKSGPPLMKGLGKFAGNFIKGKGALGFLNPVGAIANRLGAFDKKDGTQTPPAQPVQPPQPATDPMLAQGQQVPPAAAAPAAPGATPPTAPVNPQEEMVTT